MSLPAWPLPLAWWRIGALGRVMFLTLLLKVAPSLFTLVRTCLRMIRIELLFTTCFITAPVSPR